MKSLDLFLLLLLLSITFVAPSCNKSNDINLISIDFNDAKVENIDNIVESVEIIPLQSQEGHYPMGIMSLIVEDSLLIIKDYRNVIHVYSSHGKHISDSSRQIGNGEGEYSILTAFSYNKHSNTIEIATPLHMMVYDLNFNFSHSVKLPTKMPVNNEESFFIAEIYDLSSNKHFFIPTSQSENNRQVVYFDSSTEEVKNNYNFSDGVLTDISMQDHSFFKQNNDEVLFFPPGTTEYAYSINPSTFTVKKILKISYGNNGISKSDIDNLGSNNEGIRNLLLSSEKDTPLRILSCGEKIIIVTKNGNSLKNVKTTFYNTITKSLTAVNNFDEGAYTFPLIEFSDSAFLYAYADNVNLPSYLKNISKNKIQSTENNISDGEFALLKYKLKDSF